MREMDASLGVPLKEKSYAEDCSITGTTIHVRDPMAESCSQPLTLFQNAMDIFAYAHTVGWMGKAVNLRDYWLCWVLSVSFELAEYSLQAQLPNFAEVSLLHRFSQLVADI